MVASCALGDVETPRPRVEHMACYASFAAAREGWEMFVGPVPAECQHLDEVYAVELTSGPMPCKASDPGRVIGCTQDWLELISIREDLGETKRVDVSVHEWMHALSSCIRGDADGDHSDLLVWGAHPHDHAVSIAPESARAYGIVSSALGPCLE